LLATMKTTGVLVVVTVLCVAVVVQSAIISTAQRSAAEKSFGLMAHRVFHPSADPDDEYVSPLKRKQVRE